MNNEVEREFLSCFLEEKDRITSEENRKEAKKRRLDAWTTIQQRLLERTSHDIDIQKLQKKWNNIQSRMKEKLKEKLKDGRKADGGPPTKMGENDALAHRILGESNPKLVRIPGAVENGQTIGSTPSDYNETENELPEKVVITEATAVSPFSPTSFPTPTSKRKREQSLEELHKEVLLLEKEKLLLEIKRLKVETANKGCQVDTFDLMIL